MTTKVTIPREVADAIETLRSGAAGIPVRDNAYICELAMRTGGGVPVVTEVLRQIPFDTLMRALLDGYERELTEEEKQEQRYEAVRQYYRQQHDAWLNDGNHHTAPYAIKECLTLAGIVIPGINNAEGGAA